MKLISSGIPQISPEDREDLDRPILMDELHSAIKKGKQRKAPGPDGICHEFYKKFWDIIKHDLLDIINNMYLEGQVAEDQKHGNLVCLPKIDSPLHPGHYRPLSILNTDYKLLTQILATRLRVMSEQILHRNQYCGRNDLSIYDGIATVRDIIAHAEDSRYPICILTIDFKDAFDKLSHEYLFHILREYGFSDTFCHRLRTTYANATSTLTINGNTTTPISIKSGVRQGCPLSMILFSLCINPLLIKLDSMLQGISVRNNSTKTKVVAYADDVTIFLTKPSRPGNTARIH